MEQAEFLASFEGKNWGLQKQRVYNVPGPQHTQQPVYWWVFESSVILLMIMTTVIVCFGFAPKTNCLRILGGPFAEMSSL